MPTPVHAPAVTHRPRVLARGLALSASCLVLAAALAATPAPAVGFNRSDAEATLWQLLNGARVNNGLNPLISHSTLVSLARWRSKDMVERDYFDHTVKGTSWQVYHWMDSNGLQYVWAGENIGWNNGYSDADSPVSMHEGFMNSPGHRANILEPSWTHGGVGAYGADNVSFLGKMRSPRVYTELFMQAKTASTPAPTPTPPPPSTPAPTPQPTAPPPPPSSTPPPAFTPPPSTSSAPLATPTPSASLDAGSGAPSASSPLDGLEPLVGATANGHGFGPLAWDDRGAPTHPAAVTPAASPLRIQAVASSDRGVFVTMIDALLGFLLG